MHTEPSFMFWVLFLSMEATFLTGCVNDYWSSYRSGPNFKLPRNLVQILSVITTLVPLATMLVRYFDSAVAIAWVYPSVLVPPTRATKSNHRLTMGVYRAAPTTPTNGIEYSSANRQHNHSSIAVSPYPIACSL